MRKSRISFQNQFLNSALTEKNPFFSTSKVIEWLRVRNKAIKVNVTKISFQDLDYWFLEKS